MAVIGNSFAQSAFFAVVEAFEKHIKEIRLLSQPACQPFFNATKTHNDQYTVPCTLYFERTIAVITEMKPDIIFLIFL